MFDPISTYRIQFHKEYTFKDLLTTLPYLHELGVKTIYASPIFEAVPGSNHGYDVVDPHRINPEIGTLEELSQISANLKELHMTWIQDIVPNHMAFHPNNRWLMDVMEKGRDSAYAAYFDILWELPQFNGKLMVPFLGSPLADLINDRQIKIIYNDDKCLLTYGEQQYPLNAPSLASLFGNESKPEKAKIDQHLDAINQDRERLSEIIDQQYYQLSYWQDSDRMINYRRFFTVNGLICLNIQDETVFTGYHRFIKELLEKGFFQGLRVDHIDGLADPKTYLERLRALAGPETYIVVEKILESGEQFPADWPVQGNTGYDFLGIVNNLLTSAKSKSEFTAFYRELTGEKRSPLSAVPEKKAAILYNHMGGELDNLYYLFQNLGLAGKKQRFAAEDIKETIAQFLIKCPVYRFYGNRLPLIPAESAAVKAILKDIANDAPKLGDIARYFSRLFTGNPGTAITQDNIMKFYQRCMQFTGPLMAKGVEDTLMYTYDRFIAHNEVGDSPAEFGMTVSQFHTYMVDRQQHWPLSVNGTSTHDTKRGEDVRARLNVASDSPGQWLGLVREWLGQHHKVKKDIGPDDNDAYLIYQTLMGIWHFPGQEADDLEARLEAYLTKAMREAKTHTDWAEQDEKYENSVQGFTKGLLNDKSFRQSLDNYIAQTADAAVINSLTQLVLKCTCPGVPDIYQGCESWDFSLVDPDNRRPVAYEARTPLLNKYTETSLADLWIERYNGSCKTWLTRELLTLRKSIPKLFSEGAYLPLRIAGKYKENLVAFARQYQREWLIVVAPLHLSAIAETDLAKLDWEDTRIILPDDAPVQWTSVITKDNSVFNKTIAIASHFKLCHTAYGGLLRQRNSVAPV